MKARIAAPLPTIPKKPLFAAKPDKQEKDAPAFVARDSKRGKNDGATQQKVSGPVKVRSLEQGKRLVCSGAICRLKRIEKLKGEFKGLYLLEFDNHPTRGSFTTVARPDDVYYTAITSSLTE